MHSATLYAISKAASGGDGVLAVAPLIAVAGVIVGALIAGGVRIVGDRVARRAESQRQAVYDVQDAALSLRSALRGYGTDGARPAAATEFAVDLANGKLDLLIHRVNDADVRSAVAAWRKLAELYEVGDPEVTKSTEETAWRTVHYRAGEYVRRIEQSRWFR